MKKILLISLMLVLFLVGCNSNENLENNNILDNSVEQNQEQIQGTINENEKIKSLLVNGSGWNPVSAYDLIIVSGVRKS